MSKPLKQPWVLPSEQSGRIHFQFCIVSAKAEHLQKPSEQRLQFSQTISEPDSPLIWWLSLGNRVGELSLFHVKLRDELFS